MHTLQSSSLCVITKNVIYNRLFPIERGLKAKYQLFQFLKLPFLRLLNFKNVSILTKKFHNKGFV
ncbi:hypothetical protein LEP1GSC018_0318 [Leptospira kirschneri str. 2008720114]|nr:hypothetical protein LEP1GSC018_0318 [Leptospira kirschneri str. 2008720114]